MKRRFAVISLFLGSGLLLVSACNFKFPLGSPKAQPTSVYNINNPLVYDKTQKSVNPNLPANIPKKFAPALSQYPFTASKSSKIVHRRDCAQLDSIPSSDRETFRMYNQAQKQGYQPCPQCRPDLP